jgi:hypothetical protein
MAEGTCSKSDIQPMDSKDEDRDEDKYEGDMQKIPESPKRYFIEPKLHHQKTLSQNSSIC